MLIMFFHQTNSLSNNNKHFYLFATLYQFLLIFLVFTDFSTYTHGLPNQPNSNNRNPWTLNSRPNYSLNPHLFYRSTVHNRPTNVAAFPQPQIQNANGRRALPIRYQPRTVQANPKSQPSASQVLGPKANYQNPHVPNYPKLRSDLPMFPLPSPINSQNVRKTKPLIAISTKPPQVVSQGSQRTRSIGTSNARQIPRTIDQTALATDCFNGGMSFVLRNLCDFKNWPNISSIADDQKDFCRPYFEQGCKVGTNWKFCVQGRQATANSSSFNTTFDCNSIDILDDNESIGFQCCRTCQIGLKIAETEKECIKHSEDDFPSHMFNQCCSLRLKSILDQDLPKSDGAADNSTDINLEEQIANVTTIPLDVIVNALDQLIRPSTPQPATTTKNLETTTVINNSEDESSTLFESSESTETSIPALTSTLAPKSTETQTEASTEAPIEKSTETSTEGSKSEFSKENTGNEAIKEEKKTSDEEKTSEEKKNSEMNVAEDTTKHSTEPIAELSISESLASTSPVIPVVNQRSIGNCSHYYEIDSQGELRFLPSISFDSEIQENCECSSGYSFNATAKGCVDVNECETEKHECKDNTTCENIAGGWVCHWKTSHGCSEGLMWHHHEGCIDNDECWAGTKCPGNRKCIDVKNSFLCLGENECPPEFAFNVRENYCDEINCNEGHQWNQTAEDCFDIDYCTEFPCGPHSNKCENVGTGRNCTCDTGFEWINDECTDTNECKLNPCSGELMECVNTEGNYTCKCENGYQMKDDKCVDVDECSTNNPCSFLQICINLIGGHMCIDKEGFDNLELWAREFKDGKETLDELKCKRGFDLSHDYKCEDVDECLTNEHDCPENSICLNSRGNYSCECQDQFKMDENKKCISIHECLIDEDCSGDNSATCSISSIGNKCECLKGYEKSDSGSCENVDECQANSNPCSPGTKCVDIKGSYECQESCPEGMDMDSYGKCIDVDECQANRCEADKKCVNLYRTFTCLEECPSGYTIYPNKSELCHRNSSDTSLAEFVRTHVIQLHPSIDGFSESKELLIIKLSDKVECTWSLEVKDCPGVQEEHFFKKRTMQKDSFKFESLIERSIWFRSSKMVSILSTKEPLNSPQAGLIEMSCKLPDESVFYKNVVHLFVID